MSELITIQCQQSNYNRDWEVSQKKYSFRLTNLLSFRNSFKSTSQYWVAFHDNNFETSCKIPDKRLCGKKKRNDKMWHNCFFFFSFFNKYNNVIRCTKTKSLAKRDVQPCRLMIIVMMMMMSVLRMIVSTAIVHLGVKSVLASAILHYSDIAVWFLHGIFTEHFCACKTSTCELFVLCCPSWHI